MHRNLKLLALFHFFTDLDFFAPVGIIYLSMVTGSYALGMSIVSAMTVFSALFEVPTGIFSDMIGRKKTVVCGAAASLLSAVSLTLGQEYWYLLASAMFAGLGRAFQSGNTEAFIYETLEETGQEKEYHHFLGKLSSVFQLALICSAVLGSIMAARSFTLLLWVAVIPRVAMVVTALFFTEPAKRIRKSTNVFAHMGNALRLFKKNRRLSLLALTSVIQFSAGESAYSFRAAFVNTLWPLWAVGISNALSNISAGFSYFFSGNIIDRFGARKILMFEVIFNRVVNVSALLFPSPASPAVMGLSSITYGAGDVARKHLSQMEFGESERATMQSLISLFQNLGFALAAFLLGVLADRWGPVGALLTANAVLLIPLWLYNRIFRTEHAS